MGTGGLNGMKGEVGWRRLCEIDAGMLQRGRTGVIAGMVMAGSAVSGWGAPSAAELEFFEREVRPVLADALLRMPQRGREEAEGGFVSGLARRGCWRAGQRTGGGGGRAGEEPAHRVGALRERDLQMPPKTRCPKEAVAALEKWVTMGAPWPEEEGGTVKRKSFDLEGRRAEHWCWHGPRSGEPPEVAQGEWPMGAIDRFVLAKLEEAGLPPARDADRRTWIRRVTFDLTGLPPTPAEVDARSWRTSRRRRMRRWSTACWTHRHSARSGRGTGWT